MYFLQDLINKSYNLWGGGCRKYTPPTYHTANSIPQHAKRENRKILNGGQNKMLKISHLPRIMIRMKRKGKAADFQISPSGAKDAPLPYRERRGTKCVCRAFASVPKAKYPARPDIRDDASIVPYRLHLGSYRKYMSFREGTLLSKIVLRAMFVITESFLAG